MAHDELINRIRKTLYFGCDGMIEDDLEISSPLAEYCSDLFSETHRGYSLNRLHQVTVDKLEVSPCSLIMALIYLDRLSATDPKYVRQITPTELFLLSIMISTKLYNDYDEYFTISDWAKEFNVSDEKMKNMELNYLTAIEWNVHISNADFFIKLEQVEKTLAKREGLKRGWLTYTELSNFLPSFTFAKFILSNFTVMAASYCATVMTIAGAFFIVSQIPGLSLHRGNKQMSSLGKSNLETGNNVQSDTFSNCTKTPENSCSIIGLNIEEELEKLEAEYMEEHLQEVLRRKHNENTAPLINFNQNNLIPLPRASVKESETNYWHNFRHDDNVKELLIPNNNCSNLDFWNFGFYATLKNNLSNSFFPHLSLFKFM
ncbi:CNPPD1 family protein [Megaselia abdita]